MRATNPTIVSIRFLASSVFRPPPEEQWSSHYRCFYPLLSVFWFQTFPIAKGGTLTKSFYPLLSVFWFQTKLAGFAMEKGVIVSIRFLASFAFRRSVTSSRAGLLRFLSASYRLLLSDPTISGELPHLGAVSIRFLASSVFRPVYHIIL